MENLSNQPSNNLENTTPVHPDSKQPFEQRSSQSKKSNKVLVIILLVLVPVVLAGVAFGAYKLVVEPTPEFILLRAMEKITDLKSGSVVYRADLFGRANEIMPDGLDLGLEITSDFSKEESFIISDTTVRLDVPVGKKIPLVGTFEVSPELSFVTTALEESFIKIKGAEVVPFFNLGAINDKWVKLDNQSSSGLSFTQPDYSSEREKILQDKLIEAYKKYPFLTLSNEGSYEVNGGNAWKISFNLDNAIFLDFIGELEELGKDLEYEEFKKYSRDRYEYAVNTLQVDGTIYISKKTDTFSRIDFDIDYTGEEYLASFNSVLNITNFNQPVSVSAPTEFISQKEATELISVNLFGRARAQANDAKVIADVKQIQTALELYFNDQVGYPLSPVEGNRLGVDVSVLSGNGFEHVGLNNEHDRDKMIYMGLIPASPYSPGSDYLYYLCSPHTYAIEFTLGNKIGGLSEGRVFATQNGIQNVSSEEIPCVN